MKNLLLFSALFITSASAFAQLTVKPNGSTNSYVYVKNQILYVKDAINLTQNPSSDIKASIYLRDNGQLIQSGPTSSNSGNGFLSVQQNSPVTNAWAYYDWCSPVGNPAATNTTIGNKNFGINSIYETIGSELGTDARISRTVTTREGYTNPQLYISTRWLYKLITPGTEAEGSYTRINANNNVESGFGFTMKGVSLGGLPAAPSSHDQLYEFRGRPNSGNFTIPVEGPQFSGPGPTNVNAKMILSGNPYPSALDLKAVFNDNANDDLSAIFYYDEDRSVMSHYYSDKPFGYGVWVPGTNTDPNGIYTQATFYIWNAGGTRTGSSSTSTRAATPKRYAPIGQGFRFVGGGNGSGSGSVTIKNSHRVFIKEGANSIFFKPAPGTEIAEESTTQNNLNSEIGLSEQNPNIDTRTPQMRLYVVFDDALTRDMLLLFSDETTDGYDRGFDGLSPGGMRSDAFFPIGLDEERLPYVIQGTNYNVNKQIPLTFKLHKTSKVEVRLMEEINKPYQSVYLFDKLLNTYTRLLDNAAINRGIQLPEGLYEDRFYIVFRNPNILSDTTPEVAAAKENARKNVNFFQNNPAKQLEVKNPDGYTFKSAAVYDMAGKLVISEKNLGDKTHYSFYTGNLSDGVYLIKLITSEDITIDYKAIIHNQ